MKKNVVAIFGYNNTRLYDVEKIKKIVRNRHDAELLLIKEGITELDRQVAAFCLDHRPEDAHIGSILEEYLDDKTLTLIGCLPFSDKGVIGAAYAARHFGLFGDDPETALAMLDKSEFRKLESSHTFCVPRYKKPFFRKVCSEEGLRRAIATHAPVFLKPVAEGNSRGCMKVASSEDLNRWLADYGPSLPVGVICEEYLATDNEYSFDGVGGNYWITKKFTTSGVYRAEYQHIVPAPLPNDVREKVEESLAALLPQIGSRGGAIHHEFFVLDDAGIASVEPNRRPAGMMLWDLAGWVYENFDPWETWIDICLGRAASSHRLTSNGFAGVRGIISPRTGRLTGAAWDRAEVELHARFSADNLKIKVFKKSGDLVRAEPKDNSDFLAFVAMRAPTYEELLSNLAQAEAVCLTHIEVVA